jgi:5-formyltetrahydrofolate cyclo-ligase
MRGSPFQSFMTQNTSVYKQALRAQYKAKRKALTSQQRTDLQVAIFAHLSAFPLTSMQVIHLYLPIQRLVEVDTFPYWDWLKRHHPHRRVALSISDFSTGQMRLVDAATISGISSNAWGIPEPQDGQKLPLDSVDLLFMPLLGVDSKGRRLGYGKGFYDRLLQHMRADVQKIGISWFDPQEEDMPTEPWDRAIDACVTPTGIHYFSAQP